MLLSQQMLAIASSEESACTISQKESYHQSKATISASIPTPRIAQHQQIGQYTTAVPRNHAVCINSVCYYPHGGYVVPHTYYTTNYGTSAPGAPRGRYPHVAMEITSYYTPIQSPILWHTYSSSCKSTIPTTTRTCKRKSYHMFCCKVARTCKYELSSSGNWLPYYCYFV